MRLAVFASLFFVLPITGCYKPHVQNGGFACSPTDSQPCPDGFHCVNNLCVNSPLGAGGGGGGGSAGGGGGGGGSAGSGGGGGGGTASVDMSMPIAGDMAGVHDMARPPSSDMACFPFGYTCNGDATCCSQCCAGGCNFFGDCAAF